MASKRFEDIRQYSLQMIESDSERDKAFKAYRDMYHLKWDLPKEIESLQWIRKYVATDPHDSIAAAVRVLSSLKPRVKCQPYAPDDENKNLANERERNLLWQLLSADRRKSTSTTADVVTSALLYGAVAVNVVDLEWQLELAKQLNTDTKRIQGARRNGRFVINVFNPMAVHTNRSSYGIEAVLLCVDRPASEVMYEWGDAGKLSWLKEAVEHNNTIRYYDYTDYDERCVWVSGSGKPDDYGIILNPQKHELDFIPWVAMMGGTSLEEEEAHRYHPMLYPLYRAGTWESINILRTLTISDAISHAAFPRFADEGPNPDFAEVDYFDPNRPAKPKPGNVLKPLPPPGIDSALAELGDRTASEIQRATVSSVLQGGNIPSGTSFSAINLITQTAIGQLKPAKELSEKGLAGIFSLMMLWTHYSNIPLLAYEENPRMSYGSNYVIEPNEIDTNALYISVELTPDVPTDRLQRANAASIMIQYGYPKEYALEDLGVDDPKAAMQQWMFERYWEHQWNIQMQRELSMVAEESQMRQALQQQQMMQESQEAQSQGPVPQGQGWNPAMQGAPPIQGTAPEEIMREYQGEEAELPPGEGMLGEGGLGGAAMMGGI